MLINANFRSRNWVRLIGRVYHFWKRHRLCLRVRTRKTHITSAAMHSVNQDYNRRIMSSFNTCTHDLYYLINIAETPVYLNCSSSRILHQNGEKTASIMIGGRSSCRFTLAVTEAMYGTKLPLFIIFKGMTDCRIE